MNNRALILLGILMAQRQHGYQINEFIERNLSNITDMKKATAYGMLDKLNQGGYVDIEIEQDGNRPPRKVYSVNDKGRDYFLELLKQNLENSELVKDPADIGLMFIDYLPPKHVIASLKKRQLKIKRLQESLKAVPHHNHVTGVGLALDRSQALLKADSEWLSTLIQKLETKIEED